jgi:5-formyltetrahydrofolate cyclo-ligase
MTKEKIRLEVKSRKELLSREQIQRLSRSMTEKFTALKEYRECSQVILYAAFNQEVDTFPLIGLAQEAGKRVALPRVRGDKIEFYYIRSLKETSVSRLGIWEPEPVAPIELSDNNLILVPGLAFDLEGNRIGYGKGYYDSYFSSRRERFEKIAFAYSFQVYEKIPAEEHDVRMDILITESSFNRLDR